MVPLLNDHVMLRRVGNTPQILLKAFSNGCLKAYGKLEWYNPFGSLKDRAAYWMIRRAEEEGQLKKNQTVIIEPTSGNTGIALAGIAQIMGYNVEVVVPERTSDETKTLLRSLNAHILETGDDLCPRVRKGTDQSIALAEAIVKAHPNRYYMPNQYFNEANYLAHYETTGPEIWRDTEGKVTHFVTGVGTGGTITGIAQYLKERNPNVKIYAVEPQRDHHIQGLRNLEESNMPQLLAKRSNLIDEWIRISDEEAFAAVRELSFKENLLPSPSSGAVLAATLRIVGRLERGVIVAIFADDGRKHESVYREFNIFTEKELGFLEQKARFLPNGGLQNTSAYIRSIALTPHIR